MSTGHCWRLASFAIAAILSSRRSHNRGARSATSDVRMNSRSVSKSSIPSVERKKPWNSGSFSTFTSCCPDLFGDTVALISSNPQYILSDISDVVVSTKTAWFQLLYFSVRKMHLSQTFIDKITIIIYTIIRTETSRWKNMEAEIYVKSVFLLLDTLCHISL